jgi:hypothetical protein
VLLLGAFYQEEDKVLAERYTHQAVEIAEKSCGPKCEILATSLSTLFEIVKVQQGREEEAKQIEERALAALP